ncbi:MAG TPA: 30S ribosomal protein S6 [Thermoanaerobaculia bacterium]|nr:30S ribosomal protein S6 [Thermoanaerobaculia bacterium]
MRTYEVLFILSPQLAEQDSTTLIKDFRGIAEKSGATFVSEEAWGRRRLAYPIAKASEGIYHLFTFESEEEVLSELDRKMKNSDQVLRHMIVRTDLAHKRAAKLAKRNPKKERQRPTPPAMPMAPGAVAPSVDQSVSTPEVPVAEETAPAAE